MKAEEIEQRIKDEYRKHRKSDWAKIAAKKIHSNLNYAIRDNYQSGFTMGEKKAVRQHEIMTFEGFDKKISELESQNKDLIEVYDQYIKLLEESLSRHQGFMVSRPYMKMDSQEDIDKGVELRQKIEALKTKRYYEKTGYKRL